MHMGQKDEIYKGFDKEFGWEEFRVEIINTEKYGEKDFNHQLISFCQAVHFYIIFRSKHARSPFLS